MWTAPVCVASLLTAVLGAQGQSDHAIVCTRLAGNPATQLLAVNLAAGTFAPLPRFPADVLPPLSLAFDPFDGELLLAQDAGSGLSRVFRYTMNGGVPANERVMGDVPGQVTDLGFAGEDLVAAVGGAQGGVWRMPRSGGNATQVLTRAHLASMQASGNVGALAWSGSALPSDPGVGTANLSSGQFAYGPASFPFAHPVITGVVEMVTAIPRYLFAHDDGVVSLYVMFTTGMPVVINVQPAAPPGGAVAMHARARYANVPLILGGVAFPHLWTFDPFAASPARTLVAGPLPGDPVDFAVAAGDAPEMLWFGSTCGLPAMAIGTTGSPQPGTAAFRINLMTAAPNAAALFVAGFSDQLGGLLPFTLPGGCLLRTAPDAVLFHVTSATGTASQPMPVPNQSGLVGTRVFAQWLQAPGPFHASQALLVRIGR